MMPLERVWEFCFQQQNGSKPQIVAAPQPFSNPVSQFPHTLLRPATSILATFFFLSSFAWGQTEEDPAKQKEARLAEMTAMVEAITVEVFEDGERVEATKSEFPVLRTIDSARTRGGREDGSLWVWTHHGLPVAVVELFARDNSNVWGHSMILTSTKEVRSSRGQRIWAPQGEFSFEPIPGAAKPRGRSVVRRVQSRNLARRFSAYIVDQTDRRQFRLLQEPVFRYRGEDVDDGAIYAFVRGESNAEVLLLIQARKDRWEYALVRCSSNELHADLGDVEVWQVDIATNWAGSPDGPFWVYYEISE